jgi:hypothetical protein
VIGRGIGESLPNAQIRYDREHASCDRFNHVVASFLTERTTSRQKHVGDWRDEKANAWKPQKPFDHSQQYANLDT